MGTEEKIKMLEAENLRLRNELEKCKAQSETLKKELKKFKMLYGMRGWH